MFTRSLPCPLHFSSKSSSFFTSKSSFVILIAVVRHEAQNSVASTRIVNEAERYIVKMLRHACRQVEKSLRVNGKYSVLYLFDHPWQTTPLLCVTSRGPGRCAADCNLTTNSRHSHNICYDDRSFTAQLSSTVLNCFRKYNSPSGQDR
jgi:hypothetical protein